MTQNHNLLIVVVFIDRVVTKKQRGVVLLDRSHLNGDDFLKNITFMKRGRGLGKNDS